MKPQYFFTGDHHFWHKNIILPDYEDRPFKDDKGNPDVEAMNESLIKSWQKNVADDDIVCYVGDLSFGGYKKTRELLDQLPGKLLFVVGNHDTSAVLNAVQDSGKLIAPPALVHELDINGQFIVLSHYAYGVWHNSHYGSWNLFGHSHGTYIEKGKQLDVGVDTINSLGLGYCPVSFELVRGLLDSRAVAFPDHHTRETNS